jgi:uncharacterized protein
MTTFATMRRVLAAALMLAALAAPALAQTFPALTGRVVDQAGVLDAAARAALDAKLAALEAKTSDQVVVATVRSLDGLAIEAYANRLFREWRLGQKDKNNGMLFLLVPSERKVRIEIGYGLEGAFPDVVARLILAEKLAPPFRAGQAGAGIRAAIDAIADVLTEDAGQWKRRAANGESHVLEVPGWANILFIGVLGALFLTFLVCMASLLLGSLVRGLIAIHVLPVGADRRGILGKLIWFGPSAPRRREDEPAFASRSSSPKFSGGGGSSGGSGATGSW